MKQKTQQGVDMQAGLIVSAKVKKIYRTFVLLETRQKNTCRLNLKEVSDFFIANLEDIFKIGDMVDVQVLNYDDKKETYSVSFKSIRPPYLRNPFSFVFDEKNASFEKLMKFCKKELKNDGKD
ncbi:S1 RNA-binding domain-containing protein [Mycoplasma sp. 3341]|uniref:S1 RNA-binding domain-containing protein n=1 Tax=Mycoplasma sp. 3341 TaxID=3447506 RepID=UPI003F65B91C